ncbi:DUF3054 domain-containing protein [Nocardia arizonensis]|uniref:DUF3054 domain-containing protein n=1 Tax=Nocardia arizonensis TaxID=1141647 RepID=UPI0006D14D67|nr:DUF3054 domain-containing protein [Nocardia arizonensis]
MKKAAPFGVDLALVILFAAIGRGSHGEAVVSGLLETVWPFAVGLVLGWAIAFAVWLRFVPETHRRSDFDARRAWPTGVVIWLTTVGCGMMLRAITGQGVAASFVVVATIVLALFLLGWRAAMAALPRNISR